MQAQTPYTSPASQAKVLAGLAEAGFVNEVEDGRYCLNDRGRAIVDGFYESAHGGMRELQPLPAGELAQLTGLLGRIVQASEQAAEPLLKANLQASRWTDPGDDASAPIRIDQYVTDLLRYRDDAHLAAWNHLEVSGPAWEAFAFIWREENVNTAEALAERLSFRGFNAEDYAAAIEELVNQGWVAAENGRYRVTDSGTAIREAAEAETDRLFYAGWSTLSTAEVDTLDELLGRLNNNLNEIALARMWPLADGVSRAISPITRQAVASAFAENFGENGGAFFFLTLQAMGKSPDTYSAEDYVRRFPYANMERPANNLRDAAEAGFLISDGSDGYTVRQT
jgi:Mn-dependent DtxR family transcriptional regulator